MSGNPEELVQNSILAVLAEGAGARACLDACTVASMAAGNLPIAAMHVRIDPLRDIIPTEEIMLPEQQRDLELLAVREGEELHRVFRTWRAENASVSQAAWIDIEDHEGDDVQTLGAAAALNVIATVTPESRGHARSALHTCLFDTHKPVLIVPHSYQPRPLNRALVAWKDTPPGRRALTAALPWLKHAKSVRLACIGEEWQMAIDWARQQLDAANVAAEVTYSDPADEDTADALMEQAHAFDADWMIAGAYWHSEFVEWIFGGVTETLLSKATLPLFMCH